MAEKDAPLHCSSEASVLDLPDEVLREILMLLPARERVPIGNSCQRLYNLVFEDQGLLRYLDFSKKARLTLSTDVQQYFDNEKAREHTRKIDARNVVCIKPGKQLNNSIGKGRNLVEVNVQGTRFQNIKQFGSFLRPLRRLDKLSIDWPRTTKNDVDYCRRILDGPYRYLTYLSVRLRMSAFGMFTSCISLCQQLKELVMVGLGTYESGVHMNYEMKRLKNLKIVQYYGPKVIKMKTQLGMVLPEPKKWTDFQLCGAKPPEAFYVEKDVEVSEELLQSERFLDVMNSAPRRNFNLGCTLNPKHLLQEVLRINYEDVPDELCCLSTFVYRRRHLLKVEEAKLLLKNPSHQISYLYMNHEFERGCDAHLLASAFPNLLELVVHAVTRNVEPQPKDLCVQRRLNRRYGPPVPEKQCDSKDQDSSFKMLVENTPNLKHFELYLYWSEVDQYDMDTLHQISGWQKLETLQLTDVPCEDAQFLIEIAKQCKNLKKLVLRSVCSKKSGCNKVALFDMLQYCKNLRDLTIGWSGINQAELFDALAKNLEIERVQTISSEVKHSAAPWIQSVENLIGCCGNLATIISETKLKTEHDYDVLVSAIERFKKGSRRNDFQLKVSCSIVKPKLRHVEIGTVFEDLPENEPLFVHWTAD